MLSNELDREIAESIQRATAMEQRGAMLIGAASIAGALRLSESVNGLTVLALILTFSAAVAGLVVMFPRRGQLLNIRAARHKVVRMHPLAARYQLDDTKLDILEADQKWMNVRGHVTRVGFILLALSIIVGLAGTLAAVPLSTVLPLPTPTLTP